MDTHYRRHQHGLTLVEILVAVLIISVGLLGVAGLHSFSLRNNFDALLRSHASALAGDIADRMRANRQVVLTTPATYQIALNQSPPTLAADSPTAVRDLNEWRDAVAAALPQGVGSIVVAGRLATITIQWGERDDAGMQFVTVTEI